MAADGRTEGPDRVRYGLVVREKETSGSDRRQNSSEHIIGNKVRPFDKQVQRQ